MIIEIAFPYTCAADLDGFDAEIFNQSMQDDQAGQNGAYAIRYDFEQNFQSINGKQLILLVIFQQFDDFFDIRSIDFEIVRSQVKKFVIQTAGGTQCSTYTTDSGNIRINFFGKIIVGS